VNPPTDDELQAAAATLSTLVDLTAEGPTGEPDLHHHIANLNPRDAAATIAVAAAVIHTDRTRNNAFLEHAARTNRDLRQTHDRYLRTLQQIASTTASPRTRRIATDALAP
jgi:hypothetical protein